MKSKAGAAFFTLLISLLVAAPLIAHHAFGAEYDANKTIVLKGTVTKLDWMNPHVRFFVAVKDDKGNVTTWDLELQSPNTLTRQGWSRHTLKVGDEITVSAYLAKDGSKRANARGSVTLPDGKKIFAGSSADDAGPGAAK
jgi:hypothetical protein